MRCVLTCQPTNYTFSEDVRHSGKKARAKRYLVEKPLWELLEALGAHEALLVVKLTVTVHYLLGRGEATLAALAHGVGQSVGHVAGREKKQKKKHVRISIREH